MIAFLLLILAIVAYSCSQLQQHGKLRWMSMRNIYSFTGEWSYLRKYKRSDDPTGVIKYLRIDAPRNWYYKLIGSQYVEAWPTSTWLTVAFTDFYHAAQFVFFLSLSLSFTCALGFSWVKFGLVWGGVHAIHFITYKLLPR